MSSPVVSPQFERKVKSQVSSQRSLSKQEWLNALLNWTWEILMNANAVVTKMIDILIEMLIILFSRSRRSLIDVTTRVPFINVNERSRDPLDLPAAAFRPGWLRWCRRRTLETRCARCWSRGCSGARREEEAWTAATCRPDAGGKAAARSGRSLGHIFSLHTQSPRAAAKYKRTTSC